MDTDNETRGDASPGPHQENKLFKGCLIGCLSACAIAGVTLIVGFLVAIRWFGATAEIVRTDPLLTPRTGAYLCVEITPDDKGEADLIDRAGQGLRKMQTENSRRRPLPFLPAGQPLGSQSLQSFLPIRIESALLSTEGPPAGSSAIARVQLTKRYRPITAYLRLIFWMLRRRSGEPGASRIGGVPVTILEPGKEEGPPSGVAVIGNQILWASRAEDLREVLTEVGGSSGEAHPSSQPHPPPGEARLRALLPASASDLWGYMNLDRPQVRVLLDRGAADESAFGSLRQLVFTGDIVSAQRIDLSIALELEDATREPDTVAESLVTALHALFDRREIHYEPAGSPRWIDERTLVLDGRVEGLGDWIDRSVDELGKRLAATPPPAPAPGSGR